VVQDLLKEKKPAILKRWFQLIIDTYPADTSRFLGQEKNRFANPVGSTVSREIERLFDELFQETSPEKLFSCLDPVVRIRAVQDFTPSGAVGFIFLLKQAIRAELGDRLNELKDLEELSEIESRIDKIALFAFDIYMGCREKIHEIRTKELKDRSYLLMERMNRLDKEQQEAVSDGKS